MTSYKDLHEGKVEVSKAVLVRLVSTRRYLRIAKQQEMERVKEQLARSWSAPQCAAGKSSVMDDLD